MAISKINTRALSNDSVTADKVADNAITTDMISSGQVGVTDLADGAITNAKISASAAIDASKVNFGNVNVQTEFTSTSYPAVTINRDAGNATSGDYTGLIINTATSGTAQSSMGSNIRFAVDDDLVAQVSGLKYNRLAFSVDDGQGTLTNRVLIKQSGSLDILDDDLQMGGTTVIDSSRNLTNVVTYTSTAPNGYYTHIGSGNTTPGGDEPLFGIFNNSTFASANFAWGIYDSNSDGSLQIWNRNNNTTGEELLTLKRGGNVDVVTGNFQTNGSSRILNDGRGRLAETTHIGGGTNPNSGVGTLALHRSNGNPFLSFHGTDGGRNGYIQVVDGGTMYLSSEAAGGWTFHNGSGEVAKFSSVGMLTLRDPTQSARGSYTDLLIADSGASDNAQIELWGNNTSFAISHFDNDRLGIYSNVGSSWQESRGITILASNGNVGLGDTSPDERFSVSGAITSFAQATNFNAGPYRATMDIISATKIGRFGTVAGTNTPTGTQGNVQLMVNSGALVYLNNDDSVHIGGGTENSTSSFSFMNLGGDSYLNFNMDGRASPVTSLNGAYIWSGQGASGDYPAGDLTIQSRSNQSRSVHVVTGTTPTKRWSAHGNGDISQYKSAQHGYTYYTEGATVDTDFTAADGEVFEVVGHVNPNSGGSNYRDVFHGYVYVGRGWNGSALTHYLYFVMLTPPARSIYPSGSSASGNDIDIVLNNNGTETTTVSQADASNWNIRLKASNYNTSYGSNFKVSITRKV